MTKEEGEAALAKLFEAGQRVNVARDELCKKSIWLQRVNKEHQEAIGAVASAQGLFRDAQNELMGLCNRDYKSTLPCTVGEVADLMPAFSAEEQTAMDTKSIEILSGSKLS